MPAYVQSQTSSGTAASLSVTLADVVAGNLIVVTAQCASAAIRTFTGSDDQGNDYTVAMAAQSGPQDGAVLYAKNVSGGTTVVTVTASSSIAFAIAVYEVSGCSTTDPVDQTAEFNDATASDTHYSADVAGVTTSAAGVFIACAGALNSTATSTSAGTGYSAVYNTTTRLAQYRVSATALTGERGTWTSVGTDRTCFGFMASFKADSVGSLDAYAIEVQGA